MKGAILVGGKSLRMGTPKHALELGGETLLNRAIRRLSAVTSEILLAGGTSNVGPGVRWAPDSIKDAGPLSGIHAALDMADDDIAVVACDMPYFSPELLLYMQDCAEGSTADICVCRVGEYWEPLHAIYRRSALPHIKMALLGSRRVADAYRTCRLFVVDEARIAEFGTPSRLFFNINSPADYSRARAMESEGDVP